MITIVDYGMGNLGSIVNMFRRIGHRAIATKDHETIRKAEKLLLPGVGAFDAAMTRLNDSGLRGILDAKVLDSKTPILGICLGMQLLTESSEEGELSGLGWIKAKTVKFQSNTGLKVPHMGWNSASPVKQCFLTHEIGQEPRYYFVHSYCVSVSDPDCSIMKTNYGHEFDSAIGRDNIFGVQFHPEKSHRFGMQILQNFADF